MALPKAETARINKENGGALEKTELIAKKEEPEKITLKALELFMLVNSFRRAAESRF